MHPEVSTDPTVEPAQAERLIEGHLFTEREDDNDDQSETDTVLEQPGDDVQMEQTRDTRNGAYRCPVVRIHQIVRAFNTSAYPQSMYGSGLHAWYSGEADDE